MSNADACQLVETPKPSRRRRPWRLRRRKPPPLTIGKILAWADDHFEATGRWPISDSGEVSANTNETWANVNNALYVGLRGLPGKSSLARLLAERRHVRNRKALPRLTTSAILKWADDYHARTGKWPMQKAGPIPDLGWYSWALVDGALRKGQGGLSGGSSIPRLLEAERDVPNYQGQRPLRNALILSWA